MNDRPDPAFAALLDRPPLPVYLVRGDRALAEPRAERLAAALAERAGCAHQTYRLPESLAPIVNDLCTFSLFDGAKVALAVESAVFADKSAARELLAEAIEVLPPPLGEPLGGRARTAALRLLQVLKLHGLDPYRGAEAEAVAALPDELFVAPRAGRAKSKAKAKSAAEGEDPRATLAALLAAARREGLEGRGESDLGELADLVRRGLPPGHALVLAESAVADDLPLVRALAAAGAIVEAGRLSAERGGTWSGLEPLVAELERETGASITRPALVELARRTLRGEARSAAVGAESTARFVAEYRKLATLSAGQPIGAELVAEGVEDRGQEDVWQILDAMAAGRPGEVLARFERYLAAADEPEAARLSFFGLLAGLCRHVTALAGLARSLGLPPAEREYSRFKAQVAPRLQAEIAGLPVNPLAGLHPYRLHKAYLLAARLPTTELERLPGRVLETEQRLKGESGDPASALADLLLALCGPIS